MTIAFMRRSTATVEEQNARILREFSTGSAIELPSLFLVYRHSLVDQTIPAEYKYNAVLLSATRVRIPDTPYIWKLDIHTQPAEMLNGGILLTNSERQDEWCFGQSHRILVKRTSRTPQKDGKYIATEISYARSYLFTEQYQLRIPVFHLTNPTICLSSTFNRLDQPEYSDSRIKLEPYMPIIAPSELYRRQHQALPPMPSIFPAPAPQLQTQQPQQTTTMPQHIVNSYIEMSISREETCPISMAPLSRETACLTPCGHLSARHEAERWIQGAHSCPVCRSPCSVAGLQSWRQ